MDPFSIEFDENDETNDLQCDGRVYTAWHATAAFYVYHISGACFFTFIGLLTCFQLTLCVYASSSHYAIIAVNFVVVFCVV